MAMLLAYLGFPIWDQGSSLSALPPSARTGLHERYSGCSRVESSLSPLFLLELPLSVIIIQSLKDKTYFTKSCDATNWQKICLLRSREKRGSKIAGVRWRHEMNVLAAKTLFFLSLFSEHLELWRLSCYRFLNILPG